MGALVASVSPACGTSDGAPAEIDVPAITAGHELPVYVYDGPPGPDTLFQHGVASGDPLRDAVILWTRITMPDASAAVLAFWEVARDDAFTDRVAAGWAVAEADRDFTLNIDARNLPRGESLFYRFQALGRTSPIGRTRTTKVVSSEPVRFALCSCANWNAGYYAAYRFIADEENLDAVIFVGDYIYEYGPNIGGSTRVPDPPHEASSLDDYRRRYALHRSDADAQRVHAAHPMIAVWDDHEFANNAYRDGAVNHNEQTQGSWIDRKTAAIRAYHEWMPIRAQADKNIFRAFRFGDLVDLMMLDTRITARDQQVDISDVSGIESTQRTLLGAQQEAWLEAQLRASTAQYSVIGQQVMMAQLAVYVRPRGGALYLNSDQWDGYQASRAWLFDLVSSLSLQNFVVFSGDLHASFASDLVEDPWTHGGYDPHTGQGALGVEILGPSISSQPHLPLGTANVIAAENPHIQYMELLHHGYVLIEFNRVNMRASYKYIDDVSHENTTMVSGAVLEMASGTQHLTRIR